MSFTRRYTDVQAGQLYRFTVKGESLSAPDIEWVGHDTSQRYEANDELEAQIVVTAAAGIRAFTVEIISEEVLTPEVLDAVGLAPELDLVSPGDYKEPLEGLGFPPPERRSSARPPYRSTSRPSCRSFRCWVRATAISV